MNFSPYGRTSQGEALPKIPGRACKMILRDTIRHGTILSVGATNPNSTTSDSGHPQPTISGFFVPAIWAQMNFTFTPITAGVYPLLRYG